MLPYFFENFHILKGNNVPLDLTQLNNIVLKSSKTAQKQFLWEEEGVIMSNDINALIWPKMAIKRERKGL